MSQQNNQKVKKREGSCDNNTIPSNFREKGSVYLICVQSYLVKSKKKVIFY